MYEEFVPPKSIYQHQVAICKKLKRCFRLSKEHPELVCHPLTFMKISQEEKEKYLDYNLEVECHKMFMFNYLIVLLGYKKNDKISIINNPIQGKEKIGQDFIDQNKELINSLYSIRDKVYSHFDDDFLNHTRVITYQEIEKCVNFLNEYFEL